MVALGSGDIDVDPWAIAERFGFPAGVAGWFMFAQARYLERLTRSHERLVALLEAYLGISARDNSDDGNGHADDTEEDK